MPSRRLAALAATFAATLAACAEPTTVETLEPPPAAADSLVLSPQETRTVAGRPVVFQAPSTSALGEPLAGATTWSASGGTIDAEGVFVADRPGSYLVTGTRGNKKGRGKVTVDSAVPVTAVEVAPASVTLAPGAAQQFTATGRRGDGTTVGVAVTWSATGGAVDELGRFVAGATAGSFRVIARLQADTLADTAVVTVAAPAPENPVVALELAPATQQLFTGATTQFTAVLRRQDGSTAAATGAAWTALGGTVTSNGLYTAGSTAGTARVIAAHDGRADTASVTVLARVVTALVLTPASAALATGAAQQFTVAATWNDGATTVPALAWSATGGTVSAAGLYTAGATPGTYRVVVSGAGVADTAPVTLSAPVNPSLPSALFPNAPADGGWTTVGSITWTQPVPERRTYQGDNGTHLIDWGDDDPATVWPGQTAIVPDAGTPGSVKTALELRLPVGFGGGYGPAKIGQHPDWRGNGPLLWSPSLSTGWMYLGFYVRFSPGFTLNRNAGQKIFYLKSDRPENAQIAHMPGIMMADGNGGDQLWPEYQPQHPFGNYRVNWTSSNNLNDNAWHLVEILQGPNTPGVNNGTLRIWVDGRLEGSWTNARFFDAGQVPSLNRLEIAPIYGGGLNPVPRDQWIRLGAVEVRVR